MRKEGRSPHPKIRQYNELKRRLTASLELSLEDAGRLRKTVSSKLVVDRINRLVIVLKTVEADNRSLGKWMILWMPHSLMRKRFPALLREFTYLTTQSIIAL